MRQHRITRTAALVLALAALSAPAAGAQQDLRNADNRTATGAPAASAGQDLRSPDAVDAASGRGTFSAPEVTVVKVPVPSAPVTAPTGGGIDWADAGIGAGQHDRPRPAGARRHGRRRAPQAGQPRRADGLTRTTPQDREPRHAAGLSSSWLRPRAPRTPAMRAACAAPAPRGACTSPARTPSWAAVSVTVAGPSSRP